jgi:hypothetical protein
MNASRFYASLLLMPATAVAAAGIGLGMASPASAFNPQPDPPGKPIAVQNLQRFSPPDPCRCSAAVQAHQDVINRLTPTDIP